MATKYTAIFQFRTTNSLKYCNFSKIFPIMLAFCLMLSVTYYAQNYAGIIDWSLVVVL